MSRRSYELQFVEWLYAVGFSEMWDLNYSYPPGAKPGDMEIIVQVPSGAFLFEYGVTVWITGEGSSFPTQTEFTLDKAKDAVEGALVELDARYERGFSGYDGRRKYEFQREVPISVRGDATATATAVADLGTFWVLKVRWQDAILGERKGRKWRVADGFNLTQKSSGLHAGPHFPTLEAALIAWDEFLETCPSIANGGSSLDATPEERRAGKELLKRWAERGASIPEKK